MDITLRLLTLLPHHPKVIYKESKYYVLQLTRYKLGHLLSALVISIITDPTL